jgi:hypothetical protein
MNGPYADLVFDANDVCRNCLRLVRRERLDPARGGLTREYEESLERDPRTTEIGYGPGETVTDHKGVFCECGCEGVYARWWDDADVDRAKFRDLAHHLLQTLDAKGVTVHTEQTVGMALQCWRDGHTLDEAFARAVDHGLAVAQPDETDARQRAES